MFFTIDTSRCIVPRSPSRLPKLVRFLLGSCSCSPRSTSLSRLNQPGQSVDVSLFRFAIVQFEDEIHTPCSPEERIISLRSFFFVPSKCANYYACLLWVIYNMTFSNRLVQETLASHRTAETGNAIVAAVFALEFVVIRELVVCVLC
jgi:hypothetical protein